MKKASLIIMILIAALLVAFAFRVPIVGEMNSLKLIPEPEPLTELYLNDSTALPHAVKPGEVVPFSFTVHNAEGRMEQYGYEIYGILPGGERDDVASSSFELANDASTTIESGYRIATASRAIASTTPVTIYIELPAFNEDLHFTLPSRE